MPFPRVKGQIYERIPHPAGHTLGQASTRPRTSTTSSTRATSLLPSSRWPESNCRRPMTGQSFIDVLKSAKVWDRGCLAQHDARSPRNGMTWGVRTTRGIRCAPSAHRNPLRPKLRAGPLARAGDPETGYRNVDRRTHKEFLLSGFDEYYKILSASAPPRRCIWSRRIRTASRTWPRTSGSSQTKAATPRANGGDATIRRRPRACLGRADFFDTIQYTGPRGNMHMRIGLSTTRPCHDDKA